MHLGPLNALLTALESDESRHTPAHFPRFPDAPMTADMNVHVTASLW